MQKTLLSLSLILFLFFPPLSHAQTPTQTADRYFKAQVVEIEKEEEKLVAGYKNFSQTIKVRILEGEEQGKELTLETGGIAGVTLSQKLAQGDTIVLLKSQVANQAPTYTIFDRYRLDYIFYVLIGFFLLVIGIAGKKGIGAILGMGISLGVIMLFIVPQILEGRDPLLISIIGAVVIMIITIYLSHGFSKQTSVAIGGTAISLSITGIFAVYFVNILHITGLSEEANAMLAFGPTQINLQGLLLGGMIIGALGVLDDITTTQSATVFELKRTDRKLTFLELTNKGYTVGREHVASLVNTLVLAYAGVSLSLFILFVINPAHQPYWVILNSEIIIEEVGRTLAGSIGLILAVPITTFLAAYVVSRKS